MFIFSNKLSLIYFRQPVCLSITCSLDRMSVATVHTESGVCVQCTVTAVTVTACVGPSMPVSKF